MLRGAIVFWFISVCIAAMIWVPLGCAVAIILPFLLGWAMFDDWDRDRSGFPRSRR